jgi:hypothetical protein
MAAPPTPSSTGWMSSTARVSLICSEPQCWANRHHGATGPTPPAPPR